MAAEGSNGGSAARWPFVAALTLFVLLMLGGGYSLWGVARATQWLSHAAEVQRAVERLGSSFRDAEAASSYYVLTGEAAFLEPYFRAQRDWRGELERIRELTRANPAQQDRIARVDQLGRAAMSTIGASRQAYDAGRRDGALSAALTDGRRTIDDALRALRGIAQDEARLDIARQREAISRWRAAVLLFIGGAFALLLAIGAIWVERKISATERKRADELARAHELLRIVIQGIDIGVTVQSRRGELVYANRAAAAITGFDSPEALLAAPAGSVVDRFELFDREGRPLPAAELPGRAALQGTATDEVLLGFRIRGTREERWSRVRSVPAFGPSGEVVNAINFFREVTKETRAEHERAFLLRMADELGSSLDYEKRLSTVARLAVPLLADWCALDLLVDDRIERVAIAHVDPDKLALVEELERRYPSDPDSPTGVRHVIRTGKPEFIPDITPDMLRAAAVDEEHLRLIDRLELRSFLAAPLRVRGRTIGALTFAMAESDRRHTEEDLEFAQAVADRAALAIDNARLFQEVERARASVTGELAVETRRRREAEEGSKFAELFIGMLGHDLRNPLNAVRMGAALLRSKTGEDGTVARIESSAERMSNMVDQLLDFTRCRLAGGIVVDKHEVELGGLIAAVLDELRLTHPGRAIEWRGCELRGRWDRERVAQVVSNLVGNALEHGDPAEPVDVVLERQGQDTAHLSVHNRGLPISPELLPLIFDPHRRGVARGGGSKGLGLGLFITRQIVVAHGGRIELCSSGDAGTTFDVFLPGVLASG